MKILSPIFYILLLIINIVAGLILSGYPIVNMAITLLSTKKWTRLKIK